MELLGIDVGGSGIKGALVDIESGELTRDRVRVATPQPASPKAVIKSIRKLAKGFEYQGPIGVGFPAVILDGKMLSAANVADDWIGYPGQAAMAEATDCPVTLLNDADAAGIAEMRFGAGHKERGVVMILTLGTGIGSALFVHGRLVPNTELGHLCLPGHKVDAENYTSDRIRSEKNLSWLTWARRLDEYLRHLEKIFTPSLFILGGGVSKKHDRYVPLLTIHTRIVPARLRNQAGIVGAAMAAAEGMD